MRRRLIPAALAALGAVAYLLAAPRTADLAAHEYRTGLFRRQGFALWDGQWYGGHHVPGYSVLFPPAEALLGPRLAAGLAVVVAAVLFERLARRHFGRAAALGAAWFGLATAAPLFSGRLAFAFALPFALGALLALDSHRRVTAVVLAVVTSLASPVAGLFLALAAGAAVLASAEHRRPALALAAGALLPILLLAVAFPEGGTEPFAASAFWPTFAVAVVATGALLAAGRPPLGAGTALYGILLLLAFAVPSPVGGNSARLAPLLAGPLTALVLAHRRPRALAVLALPLLAWQFAAATGDVITAGGDASTRASYFAPLEAYLAGRPGPPSRVEVAFTREHWEAAYLAPRFPLARGWERQLDRRDNALFYTPLTTTEYRRWLSDLAVRFVALPDAPLDYSARAEAGLLRRGVAGLRPVWRSEHWQVWEVQPPPALVRGPGAATKLEGDAVEVTARRPGRLVVQVRYTPYWALGTGHGCVARAPGGWTAVDARAAGRLRLITRFSVGRIGARGPRCS